MTVCDSTSKWSIWIFRPFGCVEFFLLDFQNVWPDFCFTVFVVVVVVLYQYTVVSKTVNLFLLYQRKKTLHTEYNVFLFIFLLLPCFIIVWMFVFVFVHFYGRLFCFVCPQSTIRLIFPIENYSHFH